MLTFRYITRLILAFFKKFKAIILAGVILGILVFLILGFFIPSLSATTTRIGIIGRYSTNNLPESISTKISRGLTKTEESGQVLPDVAKSWETTDGGKTWFFYLNDNLYWQDEKKLVSSDINYEFSDATIERPDDKTLKFNLDNNFSAFPVVLSTPIFKRGLLGLSDQKVKKISLVGGFVQKITIQDKESNTLIYKFYPTEERLKLAFKLGEVDQISDLQDITEFNNWKTVQISKRLNYDNFVSIFLNTANEKLSDKSLRQALNYALDKKEYNENRASSPISPLSWGYNPQVKLYEKDLDKAKDIKDLEIKLSTLPNLLATAEKIKKDWEEAGAKVQIEITPNVPEDYQAFLATVDIPKDPDQYSLWHSTQTGTNISKYNNPRIDKLLEDGRTELDQETRKKIYLDFQRFLVEDSPAIFLYHPTFYTISRK
ncbi:MAG TPA: ABC transporter substrate-binding protein [Patescibacteria group bacterium]|nr:ABC transporter substrate-binding protein [Patescibacteria group bacterium]